MRGAHSHRRSRWFASLLLLLLMLMAETVRIAKTTINFLSGALPKNRHHKASFSLTREDSRMRGEAKEGERERVRKRARVEFATRADVSARMAHAGSRDRPCPVLCLCAPFTPTVANSNFAPTWRRQDGLCGSCHGWWIGNRAEEQMDG